MSEYQIEMLWRCSTCRSENKGRHKECQECGKPLEDEEFYMPGDTSRAAAVTDPGLLEQALAGPDWECAYCKSSQRRDDGSCAQCGAPQPPGSDPGPVVKSKPPRPRRSDPSVPRLRDRKRLIAIAGAVLGVAAVALTLWLILRTRVVDVSVTAASWERRVLVDRWQVCHREGWDRDPRSFNERNLGERIHHYDKVLDHHRTEHYTVQVACGQDCVPVPRTCYTTPRTCTSNKNGFATCTGGNQVCSGGGQRCTTRYCSEPRTRQVPVYRDEPRYRTWWSWDVWDWKHNRTVKAAGSGADPPAWPTDDKVGLDRGLSDGEKERQRREEEYSVTFGDGEDSWGYAPKGEAEYLSLPLKSRHRIRVGLASGVEIVKDE